ncbi:MAG: c-type cytochrome [Legionella sp.]|nr:c-type cytochrome [Legionella sp.]
MKNLILISLLYGVSSVSFADDQGKITYEIACKNCHAPQLAAAIKAPAAFNKAQWAARFRNAKLEVKNNPDKFKSPDEYLLHSVKIGKGLMHHGGLCHEADIPNKNCSDEALIQAINYMSGN